MTRKVCFISEDGQVATCIRDDENCAVCDFKADYGKGFPKDNPEPRTSLWWFGFWRRAYPC